MGSKINRNSVLTFIVLGAGALLADFYFSEAFFVPVYLYALLIRYISLGDFSNQFLTKANVVSWVITLAISILFYSASHYYPQGPMYPTGEVVCMNDGRGPCGEQYREDVSKLSVPSWVKFFKQGQGELLWMGSIVASALITNRKRLVS